MRRPDVSSRPAADGPARSDDVLSRTHPGLFERLTDDRWDDGSAREPDTLFIFHDGARWKCMLKDRSAGLVAFVSSGCFQGLLDALESGLATSTLDWRADRQRVKNKK